MCACVCVLCMYVCYGCVCACVRACVCKWYLCLCALYGTESQKHHTDDLSVQLQAQTKMYRAAAFIIIAYR